MAQCTLGYGRNENARGAAKDIPLPASSFRPPTPFLLVDEATVRRNIDRLAEYGQQNRIGIRPHTKTHKSLRIASLQLEAGAVGLTVAKPGEAEVMAREDYDLLVAYPMVDPGQAQRLAALARHATVRVAIDSDAALGVLGAAARAQRVTFGILVDIDVGLHRTGVATSDKALALAQRVDRAAGVRLDGLFFYPGQIWDPPDAQEEALEAVSSLVAATVDLWGQHGLDARCVSGGSTPTAFQSHLVTDLTEIRPGTYVFNDMNTVRGGYCSLDDCAARIVSTVVSDAVAGQVVVDAGSKTLTSDLCRPAPESGHGLVIEYPEACIVRLSEEHAQVDVGACTRRPVLGERVTIVPNHICPCVNLQDSYWWKQTDGSFTSCPVDARGKVS
jgi:D-serine deaminase-like pyridoxal phosphate-dependent protein